MNRALRALADAVAYFTIFPVATWLRPAAAPNADALACLPLVGAVVGGIAGLAGYAAASWLHAPWAFVVAWAVALALTGLVHVDGFLDACDGLFVSAPPARRFEILKDPHHGTFAVGGMAIVTALWLAALASVAPSRLPIVLAFSGAAARFVVIPVAWLVPYAAGGGMMRTFAARPNVVVSLVGLIVVEGLAWCVSPIAFAVWPAAMLLAWAGARWAAGRLGGAINGDVYGALIVTSEVLILLALRT